MPISFEPASPFIPEINRAFGAAQQWNQTFPALAQAYEAAGRNFTQASAQTAQNQTTASAASAALEGRRLALERQAEFDQAQQQRQIQAQMEMQQRQQQFEMQRMMIPISHQEEMQNVARSNGLVEIERQLAEGTLTPEQAGDARMELVTGINAFQRRQQAQQAQHMKQQAALESQRFELTEKNIMMAEAAKSELAKKGVYDWFQVDPRTGEVHHKAFNPKTGEIYNPNTGGGRGEGKEPQTEDQKWQASMTTKGGGFDYAAAHKRSTDLAKYDPSVRFDNPESPEAEKWIKDNVAGMFDVWQQGKRQSAPVTAPQQGGGQNDQAGQNQQADSMVQGVQAIDQQLQTVGSLPIPKDYQAAYANVLTKLKPLIAKGAALTANERKELEHYKALYQNIQNMIQSQQARR